MATVLVNKHFILIDFLLSPRDPGMLHDLQQTGIGTHDIEQVNQDTISLKFILFIIFHGVGRIAEFAIGSENAAVDSENYLINVIGRYFIFFLQGTHIQHDELIR